MSISTKIPFSMISGVISVAKPSGDNNHTGLPFEKTDLGDRYTQAEKPSTQLGNGRHSLALAEQVDKGDLTSDVSSALASKDMRNILLEDIPSERRHRSRYYDLESFCENLKEMNFRQFVSDEEPRRVITLIGEITKSEIKKIQIVDGDVEVGSPKFKVSIEVVKESAKTSFKILSFGGVNYKIILAHFIDHEQLDLARLAKENIEQWERLATEYLDYKVPELFHTEKSNHSVEAVDEGDFFDVLKSEALVEKIFSMRIIQSLPQDEFLYFRLFYSRKQSLVKMIRINSLNDEKAFDNTGLIFYVTNLEGKLHLSFTEAELSGAQESSYREELLNLGRNQKLSWDITYEILQSTYEETLRLMLEYALFGHFQNIKISKGGWGVSYNIEEYLKKINLDDFEDYVSHHPFFKVFKEKYNHSEWIYTSLLSNKRISALGLREVDPDNDFLDLSSSISQVRVMIVFADGKMRMVPIARTGMKSYQSTVALLPEYSDIIEGLKSEKYNHKFGALEFAEDFDLLEGVEEAWRLAKLFLNHNEIRRLKWDPAVKIDKSFLKRIVEYSGKREDWLLSISRHEIADMITEHAVYSLLRKNKKSREFILVSYPGNNRSDHQFVMTAPEEGMYDLDDSVIQIRLRVKNIAGVPGIEFVSRTGHGSLEMVRGIFPKYRKMAEEFLTVAYNHPKGIAYYVAYKNLTRRMIPKLWHIARNFLAKEEFESLKWDPEFIEKARW